MDLVQVRQALGVVLGKVLPPIGVDHGLVLQPIGVGQGGGTSANNRIGSEAGPPANQGRALQPIGVGQRCAARDRPHSARSRGAGATAAWLQSESRGRWESRRKIADRVGSERV
ncbi:hypothetical protein chiPu_0013050 [Chiloscyllium punctatum]|uniref:Uncharacterized protein n=1 Tax=Chiloscyllium punctatum TaxID=137246 RepID=A0A401SW02_CHIPU|nr:hypothetical protein [Chiloscyllium punctatum]